MQLQYVVEICLTISKVKNASKCLESDPLVPVKLWPTVQQIIFAEMVNCEFPRQPLAVPPGSQASRIPRVPVAEDSEETRGRPQNQVLGWKILNI